MDGVLALGKHRPEHRHPDEGDDFRTIAADLPDERAAARAVLLTSQRIDTGGWPRDDVRDPEAPLGKAPIVRVADWLGNEARFEQQFPESIRRAGKVMACQRRPHARVDPDEQHDDSGVDAVTKRRQRDRYN